ncbi:MAG: DUF4440 domain-containing protein [Proteobacteria bacterium]|nr:DUF4440 domain-containing protein [Pseudomonadota bacterium]
MSETLASAGLQQEIEAVIHGIFDAFQNHDPAGIEAGMHPAATVWDVFVPRLFRGAAERAEFHAADQKQMQSRGPLTLTIDPPIVDGWGEDMAIAKYTVSFAYEPPNATNGIVRITDVLRKIDGRWLVVHHHEGMVPDGIPPTNEPRATRG